MVWKMIFLYNWVIFRFHVNLLGCNGINDLQIQPSPTLIFAGFPFIKAMQTTRRLEIRVEEAR